MKNCHWVRMGALRWITISVLLLLWASSCMKPIKSNQNSATNSNSSTSATNSSSVAARQQNLQLISNWLELITANKLNESQQSFATGAALEIVPQPVNSLSQQQQQPTSSSSSTRLAQSNRTPGSRQILVATASRSARTTAADNQQQDQPVDVFVSNVCERDFMLIKVRTSRPFYGVIHTLNYRRKPYCVLEGDGASEFQLNISHVLDSRDGQYCGVIKLTRGSATAGRRQPGERDEDGELLSVVLAIRTHRNVELSDDKFLVLNCTNRCRQLDCSSGISSRLAGVSQQRFIEESPAKQRQLERESEAEIRPANSQDQRSWWARAAKRAGNQQQTIENKQQIGETCSVWRFPWLLALVLCLAILLVGCAISICIFICKLRSPLRRSPVDSHTDRDSSKAQQQVKQHTIYYDNERHQQRHSPIDVLPDRTRRSRTGHLHERPPDRRSR